MFVVYPKTTDCANVFFFSTQNAALWQLLPGYAILKPMMQTAAEKFPRNEPQKQRRLPFPWLSVAAAFFIAELGDKTQIAAVALAAQSNELTAVWAGSALGLICSNTIAVLIGKALFRHVRTSTLQLLSAVLFFLYGSYTLFSVYPPSQVQLVIYCLCLFTVAYFFALWQYRKKKDA